MSEKQRKKSGGRQKGTPNKITGEMRELFIKHARDAPAELAKLATECENPSVRLGAWKELSDRAWGKPAQVHASDPDAPLFPSLVAMNIVDPKR